LIADKSNLKILLFVFFVAVLVRWSGVFLYPNMPPAPDTIHDYDPIAANVLAGKGFVHAGGDPDSTRGPGYPLFLAMIYGIVGKSNIAVRIIQSMLDGVTVILVVYAAWILWGNWKRAIMAGSILSIYPLSVYSSNLAAVETVFCLMFFIAIFLFIKGCRSGHVGLFVASGAALGCSVLIRSTSLLFPLMLGIWFFAFTRFNKTNCVNYACLLTAFAAVILPWTIRNYYVFDEFLLTSESGGLNFFTGSSFNYLRPVEERERAQQADASTLSREIEEKEVRTPRQRDLYFRQLGWQNYKRSWQKHPWDVAMLIGYKAIRFWYATDSGRLEKFLFVMQIVFLLVSIFGVLSAVKSNRCPAEMWLLVMSVFYFWLVFIVMFPLARYTIPVIPMLAIFASLNFNKSSISPTPGAAGQKPPRRSV
jgi:4-amino-4-deoxy-L-arabinose transferase-like glycosyltransferase